MAKTLTLNMFASKNKKFGSTPINLLEIDFGGVIGTKYYSDREVTVGGNTYEAIVGNWGRIDFIMNESATTTDIQIVLINTLSSPISDIFSTIAPEGKLARIYQWDGDLDEADKTIIFNGRIASPIKYTIEDVTIDIINRTFDLDAKVGTVVTQELFPRSLTSHRGRLLPQVHGVVDNVPAVCVFTAGKSSLRETITDSSLVIEADDGSVFPTDSTWTLVIDNEQILMAAATFGSNTLTATQRGYNGTTALLHTKNTQMYEKLSTFRYQVFDDIGSLDLKAKSITNVRVNGKLIDSGDYIIDQDTYPGQIIFSAYPQTDEEKETFFDDYTFDTVINDESTPYADSPEALTDENIQIQYDAEVGELNVMPKLLHLPVQDTLTVLVNEVPTVEDIDWTRSGKSMAWISGTDLEVEDILHIEYEIKSGDLTRLTSGKRLEVQRAASLDNVNQFKRAFLVVKYFTDKEEWEGEVQARAYWDGNDLGLLTDPTFDPELEEDTSTVQSTVQSTIVNPSNPVIPAEYGNEADMIQGPEAELITGTIIEQVYPTGLEFDTPVVDMSLYGYSEEMLEIENEKLEGGKVPVGYFTAQADGLIAKVLKMEHRVVGTFAQTWEADVNNFRWIDLVYTGFSFNPPSGGGTARITSIIPRFTDELWPFNPRAHFEGYRLKKRDDEELGDLQPSLGLIWNPIYLHEIDQLYVHIRAETYIEGRSSFLAEEFEPLICYLWGKLHDVYLSIQYEVVPDEPSVPGDTPGDESTPIVITGPTRKSHEVEKTFEITEYISDWGDLLNKSAQIVFEDEGEKLNTNLYIKEMSIKTESGNYTFDYTDEITADVAGYYVDGTIITTDYGELDEVISRPDNMFKFIIGTAGFSISDFDADSYDAAAEFYIAQKYRVDFAVVGNVTLRDVVEKIAFQTRTDQYWEEGKHKIKVLEVTSAVSKSITASDIENVEVERSNIKDMINLLELRYNIDYSFLIDYTPNKFRSIINVENSDSRTTYGTYSSTDETFYFDYVRNDITATHVASYYLSFYSVIRKYMQVKCFLNQLELEKHDIIGLTFPIDSLSDTPARILSNKFIMGDYNNVDQIELYVLLEDYTYHKLVISDAVSFSESLQLIVIPVVSLGDGIEFSDVIYFGFEINQSDSIDISDSLSYIIDKSLTIYDGYTLGWGLQPWGTSSWGGNAISFRLEDVLTLEKIFASGTGFVDLMDSFSLSEVLNLILVLSPLIEDNDALNLLVLFSDNLVIT